MRNKTINLTIILFVSSLFYLGCRKNFDKELSIEQNEKLLSKFFNIPHSTPNTVIKVINFLKQENSNNPFALKLISNVGFPIWDKSELTIRKTYLRNTESTSNSDTVVLIPIVPNDKDYVNGFLAATLNGSDIQVKLYNGKEYDNFNYGEAEGQIITAEKVALQIMKFDFEVFGYNEFNLIDKELFKEDAFAIPPPTNLNRIGTVKFSETITTTQAKCIRIEVTYCDNSGKCQNQGCDWEDCPSNTCGVHIINICSSAGGGDGSGSGFGPNIGNSPTGSLGGSSGSDGPSDGQGGLGWAPNKYETELPMWIQDSLATPCIKSALLKISSGSSNTFFKKIYNTFDTSTSLILNIQEVDSIAGAYAATDYPFQSSFGTYINIDLNTFDLKKCSQEFISYTLIHEVAHAAMHANIISWDTTNTQHENMILTYLDKMATTLKTSYSTLTLKEAYSICFFGFKNAIDGKTADPRFLNIMLKQIRAKLNQPTLLTDDLDSIGRSFARTGTKGLRNCN